MQPMLIAEQHIVASESPENLELVQLKEDTLVSSPPLTHCRLHEIGFRAPPGLEDQFNAWPPANGKYVFPEDMKIEEEPEEDTTCAGSGSDRDGDSDDESLVKLSADAPEFSFGQLSADAPVFSPPSQLSACAKEFNPTPLRTSLKSNAQLFVPGSSKTKLTSGAQLFVPQTAHAQSDEVPKHTKADPVKTKTKLAVVTKKSDLFVPDFPDLKASVEMKTKAQKKR